VSRRRRRSGVTKVYSRSSEKAKRKRGGCRTVGADADTPTPGSRFRFSV
jgi:hypothetical protein